MEGIIVVVIIILIIVMWSNLDFFISEETKEKQKQEFLLKEIKAIEKKKEAIRKSQKDFMRAVAASPGGYKIKKMFPPNLLPYKIYPAKTFNLDTTLFFGKKHHGKTIKDIIKTDEGYIEWLTNHVENIYFDQQVKEAIANKYQPTVSEKYGSARQAEYDLSDTLTFGKYDGKTILTVLEEDVQYVTWCINNVNGFYLTKNAYKVYLNKNN